MEKTPANGECLVAALLELGSGSGTVSKRPREHLLEGLDRPFSFVTAVPCRGVGLRREYLTLTTADELCIRQSSPFGCVWYSFAPTASRGAVLESEQ
ncbi:MAG: hypothetical protein ACKOEM_13935 [Planctomycetia bacterium]